MSRNPFNLKKNELAVSATQFTTFMDCERKWWFARVARLPEAPKKHFAFGTALHSVCERFLLGDQTGRDKDGRPVVLYPEGWHIVDDRGRKQELTGSEQNMIRTLVDQGIEKGVIVRSLGREVEATMRRLMFSHDGTDVVLIGYIDLLLRDRVEDHKTSKAKRWFLGKKRLARNVQMLLYAGECLFRAQERGEAVPTSITVRHNQFLKNPDDLLAKFTEVEVSVEDVQRNWQQCLVIAQRMLTLRSTDDFRFVHESADSCNKYGGCPYLSICGGMDTLTQYKERMERLVQRAKEPLRAPEAIHVFYPPVVAPGEQKMTGVFEQAFGQPAAPAAGAPPPAAGGFPPQATPQPPAAPTQPAFTPQPAAPAAAPPAPAATPPVAAASPASPHEGFVLHPTAPWGTPDCRACTGVGMNTAGNPCAICVSKQAQNNGLQPAMFQVGADGQGNYCWAVLPDYASALPPQAHRGCVAIPTAPGMVPGAPHVLPAAAPPPAEGAQAPPPPPPPPPAEGAQAPQTPALEPEAGKGKGRPKKGLTVYVNCYPCKGVKTVVRLDEVFSNYAHALAEKQGATSFFALDVWKRRDMIRQAVPLIVEELKSAHVVVRMTGDNGDAECFARAVLPLASVIVETIGK